MILFCVMFIDIPTPAQKERQKNCGHQVITGSPVGRWRSLMMDVVSYLLLYLKQSLIIHVFTGDYIQCHSPNVLCVGHIGSTLGS